MSHKSYDYLIVGAGPFGAVFAYEATRRGKRCLLVERRNHVGGNLYCEDRDGIPVQRYGPHIFHSSDPAIWAYIQRFCRMNHFVNCPIANYQGKLYPLPFNMNTFYALWGVVTPAEAQAKIASQRVDPPSGTAQNLEEQALSMVGRDIYETLIKSYTEKQWGRPCHELSASIIKRLPLRFTFDNNYFNDPWQGIPETGFNPIFDQWLDGVDIQLETDYLAGREVLDRLAEKTVYSGMIDAYYDYRYGALNYRSLRFEEKRLECPNVQGNAVINYCDAQTPYTRIVEHKHFYFGKGPVSILSYEYPQAWKPGLESYYPVGDGQSRERFAQYRKLAAAEPRVIFGGRLADYAYYNMDQVIARALNVVAAEFGAE